MVQSNLREVRRDSFQSESTGNMTHRNSINCIINWEKRWGCLCINLNTRSEIEVFFHIRWALPLFELFRPLFFNVLSNSLDLCSHK